MRLITRKFDNAVCRKLECNAQSLFNGDAPDVAVSYTHLDVYKRQAHQRAAGQPRFVLQYPGPGPAAAPHRHAGADGGGHDARDAEPVSYTHLDVYKRQGTCIPAAPRP